MPSSYIICNTLQDIDDVFNVELFWHPVSPFRKGRSLQEMLIKNPRTVRRRGISLTYFYHVVVRIPYRDYRSDDLLYAGSQRQALLEDLHTIHHHNLGRYVPDGHTIRYRIEADRTLQDRHICFLFGPAIYIPDEQEQPIYRLSYQTASTRLQELGVIYPQQRLVLLNGYPDASTFAVPAWPFANEQSALLILEPDQPPRVEPEPDGSGALQVEHRGQTTFLLRDARDQTVSLHLQPWIDETTIEYHEQATWTPNHATSASHSALLQIVGVALPRPSLYAEDGLLGWRLAWTNEGMPVHCKNRDAVAWLQIDTHDQLLGETGEHSTLLQLPITWPLNDNCSLSLQGVPAQMHAQYCAWLRLPKPIPLLVPAGDWFSFGRGRSMTAPGLFNDPDGLQWQNQHRQENPEQRWLSRQHLGLRRDESSWRVRIDSKTWPVYQLDPASGALLQSLSPARHDEECSVAIGAWWVAGAYILELG